MTNEEFKSYFQDQIERRSSSPLREIHPNYDLYYCIVTHVSDTDIDLKLESINITELDDFDPTNLEKNNTNDKLPSFKYK
jgi:hypothetical protein